MTSVALKPESEKLAIHGGPPLITASLPFTGHGKELTGDEEAANVLQVVRTKRLARYEVPYEESVSGRLEMALEKYLDVKHVYLTCSGSLAGTVSVLAAGIGPGDEVIVPSITWQTVPGAVIAAGAVPIVAQVDETLTIDVADVERLITPRTKAIVPTHVHGFGCDMDPIMALAKKHNFAVLEDVAQSSGGSYKGRRFGAIGDIGFFSFNCMKLIAAGDGGFISTNRDDLYEYAASYFGAYVFPNHKRHMNLKARILPGTVARITELTSAVALAQFNRLEPMIQKMRGIRDVLDKETTGCKTFGRGPSHDRAGECGVSFSMLFRDDQTCARFGEALRAEGVPMATSRDYFAFHAPSEMTDLMAVGQTHQPVMEMRGIWAMMWPAMLQKQAIHPELNPWTHPSYKGGPVEYGPDVMARSLEKMGKILLIRINPRLEPEHARLIGAAIRKVDAAFSR